jgi:hypothetical protein
VVKEGFYGVVFGGAIGSGLGLIALRDGMITGVDGGGGTYDGTYREEPATGDLAVDLAIQVPAHVPLVTGAAAQAEPWTLRIATTLRSNFAGGMPVVLPTESGPISVTFSFLRPF